MNSNEQHEEILNQAVALLAKNEYLRAAYLFEEINYKPGLKQIADIYMYKLKTPLVAYSYYEKAGETDKMQEIQKKLFQVLGHWISQDDGEPNRATTHKDKDTTNTKISKKFIEDLIAKKTSKLTENPHHDMPITVPPELKQVASEILRKNAK